MTAMRMRMDFVHSANQTLDEIEALLDLLSENDIDHDVMPMADVRFRVLGGYLQAIAARAIELNDKPLLDLMQGLGCVTEDADEPSSFEPKE